MSDSEISRETPLFRSVAVSDQQAVVIVKTIIERSAIRNSAYVKCEYIVNSLNTLNGLGLSAHFRFLLEPAVRNAMKHLNHVERLGALQFNLDAVIANAEMTMVIDWSDVPAYDGSVIRNPVMEEWAKRLFSGSYSGPLNPVNHE